MPPSPDALKINFYIFFAFTIDISGIGDNLPHVCSQGGGSFMYLVVLGVYVVLAVAAAWVMALLRRR